MDFFDKKERKKKKKIFLKNFWIFLRFSDFLTFMKNFGFFGGRWGILFQVNKGTTKSYQGYYWAPTIAKIGPKQHNKLSFCPKGKKSLCRSPPQELEVGPRSGPYLLVLIKVTV